MTMMRAKARAKPMIVMGCDTMGNELHLFKELLRCSGINESVKNNPQFKEEVSLIEKALKRNDPMPLQVITECYSHDPYGSGYYPEGSLGYDEKEKTCESTYFTTCCGTHLADIEDVDCVDIANLPNFCPRCGTAIDKSNLKEDKE